MDKPRILVTRRLPEAAEARLRAAHDVRLSPDDVPLSAAALAEAMRAFDVIVPTVSDRLDATLLRAPGRRVRMIANVGVGFSNIDIDAARAEGIVVSNTPDVLTDATADIAMLLILATTRRAHAAEAMLRAGRWAGFSLVDGLGTSIQGKVLGIIGMGRIGRATARRAALGFGMQIVYFNRSAVADPGVPATALDSVAAVMAAADVVSVHVPGGAGAPVVGAAEIACMKPGAHLVNTARGDSVDQEALIGALRSGRIAGAGLDVYAAEPHVPEALRALENVTLLPHIGSATREVRTAMAMLAIDNLQAFLHHAEPPNRVV